MLRLLQGTPPVRQGFPASNTRSRRAVFGGSYALTGWSAAWAQEVADSIQVFVTWEQQQPAPDDLHAFIQVLNPAGQAIAVWDQILPPAPTVSYRVALSLPQTTPSEELRLIAGLYRAANGERLRLPDGSDALELTRFTP